MPDLLAGRVQVNFAPLSAGLQYTKDGKLRALGCIAPVRVADLPDVPTFNEAGIPDVSVPTWQAVFAPPKTPQAVADRMSAEISNALQDRELRTQYARQTFQTQASTPEKLRATISEDLVTWAKFIRDNAIVPE
jgi:tripartite-type tricarboxylate transporter receptor subunit TctC